ncbi:hypothetical protein CEXT_292171 [Caerostris extrusa]|uniref:Uncharacterized protein n=1 Tax=Caerostris extrusa TaxID=172846 RepID=A0AAV4VSM7_CAEEX|nr:hypothetical protein CEXT_292171 [Caerostris extrusa]
MEPKDVSLERRDLKSFEKEGFQTENEELNDFYLRFQELQISTGSIICKLSYAKTLDCFKNTRDSSFGELETKIRFFLRENNKLSTSIEELSKNLAAHIHKTLLISTTHASDFEAKFKNRLNFVALLTKKKKELKSLTEEASSKLKLRIIEETLKNKEHDLKRYVTAPWVKEDFKRFICGLVKYVEEYHKISLKMSSNLEKIMKCVIEISRDETGSYDKNKACVYQENKKFKRSSLKRTHGNIEKGNKKFKESSEIHPSVLELFEYCKSSSEESDDDIEELDK